MKLITLWSSERPPNIKIMGPILKAETAYYF